MLSGRFDGELALWSPAEGSTNNLVTSQDGSRLASAVVQALLRRRAEDEAARYSQLARGVLDALEAPTCAVTTNSDIVAVNEAWRAFAVSNGGHLKGLGVGANYLLACDQADAGPGDSHASALVAYGLRLVLDGYLGRFEHEYPWQGPDEERWFSVRIAPAEIDSTRGAVISHVDITAMHDVQQALSHQTSHDPLTGLPNRQLLTDRLNRALADTDRRGTQVGVACLDLDNFKRINDSLGYAAGDLLLVKVAERLTRLVRDTDTVARLSGDEFVVVWPDLDSPAELTVLSDRLVEALTAPFSIGQTSVTISASIGVATAGSARSGAALLQAADAAMYDAKQHSRGRVRIFSTELRQGVEDRMSIEVDLRAALTRNELVLHYQPVIDLETGRPVAVEALVRWNHPRHGLIGPAGFIPIAEASGLIVPLGEWVLDQACLDAVSFTGPAEGLKVAVNFSARELTQPDVLTHVRDALAQSGLEPGRLLIEVTETAVMEDEDAAEITLKELSRLGIPIAIDDFGTGYSSLHLLRRGPIGALKLDRSFVSGIVDRPSDRAICASVVGLAHALGAKSIAEGVETPEQLAALRAFGCHQAQGFLWSAAVPVGELNQALLACSDVPLPLGPAQATLRVEPLGPEAAAPAAGVQLAGSGPRQESAAQTAAVSIAESIAANAAAEVAAEAAATAEAAVAAAAVAAATATAKASRVAAQAVLAAAAAAQAVADAVPQPRDENPYMATGASGAEFGPQANDARVAAAATAEATAEASVTAAAAAVAKIALAVAMAATVAADAATEAVVLIETQLNLDIAAAALAVSGSTDAA